MKNIALSYMRYHGAVLVASQQQDRDEPISERILSATKDQSFQVVQEFVKLSPDDKDITTFTKFLESIDTTKPQEATPNKISPKKKKKKKKNQKKKFGKNKSAVINGHNVKTPHAEAEDEL